MLSLFKRKPAGMTFKSRVLQWWDWYGSVAPRFFETIEAGECPSLAGEVSEKVDELFPGLAWVFGPGAGGQGHSFTLSGEGVLYRQLLTQYWHRQAPALDGWTFYASRQPGSIEGIVMDIGGQQFNPIEFWLTPQVNKEAEKVELTVWHPLYEHMEENERWRVLFLFLDEVMGEFGTQQWIGEIALNNRRLAESIPLTELRSFLDNVMTQTGWRKYDPGEAISLYQLDEPHDRFPRGDIIVGNTCCPPLLDDYMEAKGKLEDPLAGLGADYVYVALDARILPPGEETEARGRIEDALNEALRAEASGRLLGGAHGIQNAYVDLLLFDGEESMAIVERVLREQGLPAGTRVEYFAKDKRGRGVVL
jgi:hypothetical protein